MTSALSVCYEGCIAPEDRHGLRGGVLKYWAQLLQSLPDTIQGYLSGRQGMGGEAWPRHVRQPFFPHFRPHRASLLCEDLSSRIAEPRGGFSIVHPTYYELGRLSRRLKKRGTPLALTVYDLIQEKHIGQADRLIATGAKREAILAADLLVCISESTAADLQEIYGIDRKRIRVIFPGNDLALPLVEERPRRYGSERLHSLETQPLEGGVPATLSSTRAPGIAVAPPSSGISNLWDNRQSPPYFLVVGNRSGYKNFSAAAQAFASISGKWKQIQLRLAGPPLSAEESGMLSQLGILDRVQSLGRPSEEALGQAYAGSVALVYPSLIEGFGFPIVEAMACGTPVITSDCSSLKEVAGGCALLANPQKPAEIASAMEHLLENESARASLIEKGRAHARLFRWDRAGQQLAQAYSEILA
jgi:glycosyltransferase involved in cell wall biosynthesis